MKHLALARCVFALLFIIVTYLTITTRPDDTKTGFDLFDWLASVLFGSDALGDKLAHFTAYSSLGFMSGPARLRILDRAWPVLIALAAWGVLLEGVQALGGVRHGDALDASANALGAVAGFAGFALLAFLLNRRARA